MGRYTFFRLWFNITHFIIYLILFRLDYDLHSRILVSLAEVLADSRTKTTIDEVERLVSKCPDVPILPMDDLNIVIPNKSFVDRMVVYTIRKKCICNTN
jgi:hypothetical protein